VFVGEASTREEVLEWMRDQELNLDQLDTVVLLDDNAHYSGTVSVRGCFWQRLTNEWRS